MRYTIVELASLKDLLLISPDRIYRIGERCFIGTVGSDFMVIWITRYKEKLKKFVCLLGDMTISTTDMKRPNHIPVIRVNKIYEVESFKETRET